MKAGLGLLLAVLVAAAGVWLLPQSGQRHAILINESFARPIDPDRAVAIMSIENSGAPDRLIAVDSNTAEVSLYSPADPAGPPIQTGASSLALDGAHIRIGLKEPLGDGALIPVTLMFEVAGPVTTRLRLSDPAAAGDANQAGLFGLGDICVVGDGEPAPQITLRIAEAADGWDVHVDTEEFTFSQEFVGLYHIPGMGHGHIYVGGTKLDRMYAPMARIGALPKGRHEVRVTLNTNDHRAYVIGDEPVTASAYIVVD